ncbi:S8 family serine peptidase [Thermomonospora umbrina]|uniref:Alpha-tubulin suppressor-like RCC1 family protein n=1 Tax=Thermomonospora umbrina TaxID=111806 RepID=A0A3D9SGV5_9ACTN|nr:S8 family serine peptidase [Thermomonospora umbrina]REE94927.1 alpha-tubulin suppressor-like RCC1 family protein [Thermomonospora umbrina]
MSAPPGPRPPSRRSVPRRLASVALALAIGGLPMMTTASSRAAAPEPRPAYDHGKDKGRIPGSRGPLPKGFSTTELTVKFKAERKVRVRAQRPVAKDDGDANALRTILARYPGAEIRPSYNRPEKEIDDHRIKVEARTGRELPDLNSWFTIHVPKGIEGLLKDLNALPSVEIAQAQPIVKAPAEPLRPNQNYRNAVGAPGGTGVDADAANSLPGGKGEGITVTDIEVGSYWSPWTVHGAVAAGGRHSLVMAGGRHLWVWGDNGQGQLGNGTTTDSRVPIRLSGISDVKVVSAAADYSVAVKMDGTVWAWGDNAKGQLGNGTTTDSNVPVQVPGITNAASVAAGSDGHVLAVLTDGTVKAWGNNDNGQLGNGTTTSSTTPVTVPGLTGARTTPEAVSAGGGHSAVALTNYTVKTWGRNDSGQLGTGNTTPSSVPVTVPGLIADEVSAGGAHTLAVNFADPVRAWGRNDRGQLGDGTTTNRLSPVQLPSMTYVTGIAAGAAHSVVTTNLNRSYAWGANDQGQVGNGGTADTGTPFELPVSFQGLAAGANHNVTVKSTWGSRVYTWGANAGGQLGRGDTAGAGAPVELPYLVNVTNLCHEDLAGRPGPAGPPINVPATVGTPCNNRYDSQFSGENPHHATAVAGIIGAQDDNGVGIAGIAPRAKLHMSATLVDGGATAYAVTHSSPGDVILYEVATTSPQGWYPWELSAQVYDQTVLAVASGVTVVEAAGNGGNDLDRTDDENAVTVMSRPNSGALMVGAGEPPSPGGGNCNGSNRPAERTAMSFSTYGSRVDVQAYGTCIWSTGNLGGGSYPPGGTDGNKIYTSSFSGTSGASAIMAGTVAALQGVAKNHGFPLSPEQVKDVLKRTGTPQPTADTHHIGPQPNLRAAVNHLRGGIAAGDAHALAVRPDGTVRAWGRNYDGQLGTGTTTSSTTPVPVSGLTGVARTAGSVSGGVGHSLALKTDGTVWAWGDNANGQLGDGTTTDRLTPVQVSGLNGVVAVSAGGFFSLALKSDGTVWAWGSNGAGQLGTGSVTAPSTTPVQVGGGLTGVAAVSGGEHHSLAVRTDGTVWAWGSNTKGALGDGTTTLRAGPVQVTGLTGVSTWQGAVAAGRDHSVAVKTDGTVRAWGDNFSGKLGDGTTTDRHTPVTVTGLSQALTVSAGDFHTYAVRGNRTTAAWGYNGFGQIGNGQTGGSVTTPVTVHQLTGATGVAGGYWSGLATRADGTLFSWGSNAYGQLGDGTYTDRNIPAQISGTP